ncbi:MAG: hypothetical protein GX575_19560 [Candidatus Anammoximicrobium sp.]|nr:hypothetical protein [Candidatus Anammoximicrobium sp.]
MDKEIAGRFREDHALDQRIDLAADINLVVAHDGIVRRHADAHPGSGIVPHTGQIDHVPADDRVGRGQMTGVAGPVGLDRRRAEVDEDVVLDDDRRGAVARADGAAAVDHLLLESFQCLIDSVDNVLNKVGSYFKMTFSPDSIFAGKNF